MAGTLRNKSAGPALPGARLWVCRARSDLLVWRDEARSLEVMEDFDGDCGQGRKELPAEE